MKLSNFLMLKAIVSFIFALGALIAPVYLVALHGAQVDAFGSVVTRYYGTLLLGVGMICWYVKDMNASELRQGILLALFISDTIGFLIGVMAQLTINLGVLGWIDTAIWFMLALGLGYFRFMQSGNV